MAKILIVDDEAKIRELIKKYATYEGYICDEAPDGEDAVGFNADGTIFTIRAKLFLLNN